jgi:phospholipid-binding lipoprotein MlaA
VINRSFLVWALIAGFALATAPALADPAETVEDPPLVQQAATASEPCPSTVDDPFEPINRATSAFNRVVRENVVDPAVDAYQDSAPEDVQHGVSNFFSNLTEPVTIVSSLIEGDLDNAGSATERFAINTTYGLLGVNDKAAEMGIAQRREDLGQAFGTHGVCPGPHIVLPLLGPSNLRDAAGDIATGLLNPLPLAAQAAQSTVEYSDNQDVIQAATATSIDPYVTERDSYEQYREFQVQNGVAIPAMDMAEFEEAYEDEPGS